MKIVFSIFAIACGLSFSSCSEKDYTCHCEGGISGAGTKNTVNAVSKRKAEKKCTAFNQPSGTADGFHNCALQ